MDENNALLAEIESLQGQVALLEENFATRALELETVGWKLISGFQAEDDGPTLEILHGLAPQLREMASTNPWHKRGAQLRHSYIFGRGMTFQEIKPGTRAALDDPHNKEVMFSVKAYEKNNLALFTDGNLIVFRNVRTNRLQTIPVTQISAVICDPDDDSVIRFVQRSWSSNGTARSVWYPVARYKTEQRGEIPKTITQGADTKPVSQDVVVYINRANRQDGWTWGVPDSLAAKIFAIAYSGYLQDNSKLVHALSKFAWTITSGSKAGVDRAASQVVQPGVGGVAGMGEGQNLASVGVPSAQVNMNNGQPLAAAVAASLGVPVIALISSPGATGGSYGAATTLDAPTLKGFEALQDSWKDFYEEILRDMGSKKAVVEYPAIENDPPYRQITAIATAVELGLIWPDEGRQAVLNVLDVPKLHENAPPKPEPSSKTVVSARGESGAVPGGQEQGDTNHDGDSDRE